VTIAQTKTCKAQGELPTDKFLGQIKHESLPNDGGIRNISQCVSDTWQQASYIHQTPQQASYAQQEPHKTTYVPQIPILPQQPNYTIQPSQAVTTSRATAQTADFSEAEESTDSDENDDRLSWQEVSGRDKKRTGPRTIKVPTTEKNKHQETNNHPTQLTITNKFEALRHAETEGNTKHERKDPAPPLIFVPGITNMQ
jgi:hypothetical protein